MQEKLLREKNFLKQVKVDNIAIENYVNLRLIGYSPNRALSELNCEKGAEYKNTYIYQNGEIKLRSILIKEGLDSENIVKRFKKLIFMKIELEEQVLEKALNDKGFKNKLMTISKSKDNIGDLSKLVRLLEGRSTENVNLVSDEEYQYESNRLKFLQNAGNPSSPAKN